MRKVEVGDFEADEYDRATQLSDDHVERGVSRAVPSRKGAHDGWVGIGAVTILPARVRAVLDACRGDAANCTETQ